jgi:hypothetical protein
MPPAGSCNAGSAAAFELKAAEEMRTEEEEVEEEEETAVGAGQ